MSTAQQTSGRSVEPFLDLETDANAALVRYPNGYAEFHGSRFGRERYAKMFLALVTDDRRSEVGRLPETELNQWKACADKLAGASKASLQFGLNGAETYSAHEASENGIYLAAALREYESLKKGGA